MSQSRFLPLRGAHRAVLLLALVAAPAGAQDATGSPTPAAPTLAQASLPADSAFVRARRLVNEGHGAAGRAILDSVFTAAAPGSAQAAEALWWRASLAASSTDAERDYRRLAVEYPVSTRAEDALLRLAQMELTRGDRQQAVRHLERLALEHPNGASRPRAAYWMARIKFELNDAAGACAAIASARASTPPEEVELRNQIDFTARRCSRLETARATDSSAATVEATAVGASPAVTSPDAPVVAAPTPSAGPPVSRPTTVASAPVNPPPAPASAAPAAGTRTFVVQVAAFDTRRAADALVAKLKTNGHTARVDGSVAPFRVRVGRYRTREEAVAAQKRLADRKISGFVVAETSTR